MDQRELELEEEAKLRQKYPNLSRQGLGNSVLQKRLSRGGPKYFDSGDYNMAKAKTNAPPTLSCPQPGVLNITGDTIPSPETVPAIKTPVFPVDAANQHQHQHPLPPVAIDVAVGAAK